MKKLIISGVGGQGVTYLVRLLMHAAVLADIKVATGEIHGLSQRGGMVNAGITFGEPGHGQVDAGEADFMIGLERLEAQRCASYLNSGSRVVINNTEIMPYAVNAGISQYPDMETFVSRLKDCIEEVVYVRDDTTIDPRYQLYFVLGIASSLQGFPVGYNYLSQAIELIARKGGQAPAIAACELGRSYN
ncbi:MAG: hypothetical protein GY763_15285 [Gammaproteobacteria bacterium]|nr:hypothetical protein [Gammaproteobacteria bacterium]